MCVQRGGRNPEKQSERNIENKRLSRTQSTTDSAEAKEPLIGRNPEANTNTDNVKDLALAENILVDETDIYNPSFENKIFVENHMEIHYDDSKGSHTMGQSSCGIEKWNESASTIGPTLNNENLRTQVLYHLMQFVNQYPTHSCHRLYFTHHWHLTLLHFCESVRIL